MVTFPPAFLTVMSYFGKVNTLFFVILLQMQKVNFFEQVANFDYTSKSIKICHLLNNSLDTLATA